MKNGEGKELSFRDAINKIIHARSFKWDFDTHSFPVLICISKEVKWLREEKQWYKAEINITSIAGECGSIIS